MKMSCWLGYIHSHGIRNYYSVRCVGTVFVLCVSLILKSYCHSSKVVKSSSLFYYYQNYVKRHLCGKSVSNDSRKNYINSFFFFLSPDLHNFKLQWGF